MRHLDFLEDYITQLETRIAELIARDPRPHPDGGGDPAADKPAPLALPQAVERLCEIPGVAARTAQNTLAEIGTDMSRFPTAHHLASWARVCPGNEESAGKRKRATTGKSNRWLRRSLTESAWAASHTKDTYLSAQYRRVAKRRGKKRAIVALGHTILTIAYHMLKENRHYEELGADFFDRLNPERVKRYHVSRLHSLGYAVQLEELKPAA